MITPHLYYFIINRRSVSISPLTYLFYQREVSFTIHHKFLLVYITLFQLSTLYSVVYLVCKSKHVCDKVAIFSTSRALKNWQTGFQVFCLKLCIFLVLDSPTITPIRRKNTQWRKYNAEKLASEAS